MANTRPPPPSSPALAYRDASFLDSDEGRPVRILAEYLEPLKRFREQHVHDTVVFFGSARLKEDGPLGRYYVQAQELAHRLTEWSASMSASHRLVVCSGGGGGIMEAVNRGALEAGGRSVGLNIGLPHEQRPNAFITPELSFQFHYFFMRKLWFAHLARALVVFPGGFGTLDELTEFLTLSQTQKLERPLTILLYGSQFWREVLNFDALVKYGTIAESDLKLFRYVDSVEQGMECLKACLAPEPLVEKRGPSFAKSRTPNGQGER